MYVFAYLRASTIEQDANRAKKNLKSFVESKNSRIASWFIENVSGASLERPELMKLLNNAEPGDAILIEQVDRLSRLSEDNWNTLKHLINEKGLLIISLDLPTSHVALDVLNKDSFTSSMLKAINNMLLDMLAAISRKDYEDRRRRQLEGIDKAKSQGKFKGRKSDPERNKRIYELRVVHGVSIKDTAKLTGVSQRTVARIIQQTKNFISESTDG